MTNRELANSINKKLTEVSDVFGQYQNTSGLHCPTDCGRCCFKADISCSPYELLPMAYELMENGKAEEVLEKAKLHQGSNCLFLEVSDEVRGTGRCSEYQHRPFICRAFGLSARIGKHEKIERSICKTLIDKEKSLPHLHLIEEEIPLIDVWKKRLESIDPHLQDKEIPIHLGIAMILENLLLWKELSDRSIL